MQEMGRMLLIVGGMIFLLGIFLVVGNRIPFLGKLPGDIFIQRGNFSFYFPIVTSIIVSIILTIVANLFFRR